MPKLRRTYAGAARAPVRGTLSRLSTPLGLLMSVRTISTLLALAASSLCLANCSDAPGAAVGAAGTAGVGGETNAAGHAGMSAGAASMGGSVGGGGAGGGGAMSTAGGGVDGGGASGVNAGGAGAASGGAGAGGGGNAGVTGAAGSAGAGAFSLTSPDLMDGAKFQDKNTCNGKAFGDDESPALMWSEPPAGTKSFALVFIDVTLTASNPSNPLGHHWMAYDIPAATRALPAHLADGATLTTPVALKQVPSSYLGPCPGGTLDTYELTLYALSVETIDPGTGAMLTKAMVDKVKAAALGSAVLHGMSDAKSK